MFVMPAKLRQCNLKQNKSLRTLAAITKLPQGSTVGSIMSEYQLFTFTEEEQRELLGTDIGGEYPVLVVELDKQSQRCFYNRRYAPMSIRQYESHGSLPPTEVFQVIVHSIDDSSLNMTWEVSKMDVSTHVARSLITEWLERTGYFLNLKWF